MDRVAPRRIVVIDPAFVGDVVFDAPLIRALRSQIPDAFLGLLVRPPSDAVARRIIGLNRVHVFDKRRTQRGLSGLRSAARELRAEGYDAALIPHPSLRSTTLARLAGIRIRIGNATPPARWLLTHAIEPSPHHIDARLSLLAPFAHPERADRSLSHTLRRSTHDMRPNQIGLVLGANWATKRWPLEHFIELARKAPPEAALVLLGAEEDRPAAQTLREAIGGERSIIDATGDTLDTLISAIERCSLIIGGDTGPLHIARALGIRTVALFGPTPIDRHVFAATDQVLAVDLPCRPCHPHGPAVCPEGHHKCLRDLKPDRVLEALAP